MPKVVQLISRNALLIEAVKTIVTPFRNLRLEIRPDCPAGSSQEVAAYLLNLPGQKDLQDTAQVVKYLATADTPQIILVLSDSYQDDQAVTVLRAGATDYFGISSDLCRLRNFLELVSQGSGWGKQREANSLDMSASPSFHNRFSFVLSPEMVDMMDQVQRVAPQETTVFLTGETGTGKTQLARLIHELSPRRAEPFLVVDCGALSANLMESEIFGHRKGSFTGARCDRKGKLAAVGRGTLFLDEINSLSPVLQGKLLRAVDERVYEPLGSNKTCTLKARIIAAANIPLEQAVKAGNLRQDLYYRLNVVSFFLSPLRERRALIRLLVNKFLAEIAGRNQMEISAFTQEAMQVLIDHDWPGNIRELRNTIERAVVLASGPHIQKSDLAWLFPSLESFVPDSPNKPSSFRGLARRRDFRNRQGSLFQTGLELENN